MGRAQQVLGDHQVRQSEQAEQLRGVLRESFVAHLTMVKQVLDDMKRMLDPRADLRLGSLDLDQQILQRTFAHRLDLPALDRYVPLHRLALHLIAFVHARVASVAEGFALVAVQQGMGLRDIGLVGRGAHYAVNQTRVGIDTDVG